MSRIIFCEKLQKEAEGMARQPYPGVVGKEIYEHISQEGWQLWVNHQTMLINEYRLNMLDKEARKFLEDEMQKFLFEGDSSKPAGYVPPTN